MTDGKPRDDRDRDRHLTRLSKAVAHALRHAPWVYELELEPGGWVPLEQLVDGLRRERCLPRPGPGCEAVLCGRAGAEDDGNQHGTLDPGAGTEAGAACGLTTVEVRRMVAAAAKQRYEIADGRIRALYGHTVAVAIPRQPSTPPDVLYHGTARHALEAIRREGLTPRLRHYVHLAATADTAMRVGLRKDARPALLVVDAAAASAAGITFYAAGADVWLTDHMPAAFLRGLT